MHVRFRQEMWACFGILKMKATDAERTAASSLDMVSWSSACSDTSMPSAACKKAREISRALIRNAVNFCSPVMPARRAASGSVSALRRAACQKKQLGSMRRYG